MAKRRAPKTTKRAGRKTGKRTAALKSKSLRPGDKVSWNTSQGRTKGRVVKKQTRRTKIKTHKVAASKRNPEYIVESKKSGKRLRIRGVG